MNTDLIIITTKPNYLPGKSPKSSSQLFAAATGITSLPKTLQDFYEKDESGKAKGINYLFRLPGPSLVFAARALDKDDLGDLSGAMQQQVRASFLNPALQTMVDETLAALDQRKEQGAKPERQWFVDRQEHGTACIAEWMGY